VKTIERIEGHYKTRKVRAGRRHVLEDCYSWMDSYLERLEGKEARHEYYVQLARSES
jgi:hypothetical protein